MQGYSWVVSVDMGYGHQRAAYPLKDMAYERILTANSDKIISYEERRKWESTRVLYERISRLKQLPVIGERLFNLYDNIQAISPFFPFRDLSKPTMGVLLLKKQIENGLCKSLVEYVRNREIPFFATHPFPALAAHYMGLKKIYCLVTDTDLHRAWVIDEPKNNTITYFAPCVHVAVRLREYGISEDKIILSGFPLPKENVGGEIYSILKKDLSERLANLDPNKVFIKDYKDTISKKLGSVPLRSDHVLTLTYAVGGAGAQSDVGIKILKSLKERVLAKQVRINLAAGTRLDVLSYYRKEVESLGLLRHLGKSINIVFALDKKDYFASFNKCLRQTDILWTKPSELSFYTALGLPIIIAPPVGAHEVYNKEWLSHMGSGFVQENPEFVNDWLFYWLEEGRLAKAAWNGWLEAPSLGTYKIEKILKSA
jgi:hypothetical protein